jgi:hypothetical protein
MSHLCVSLMPDWQPVVSGKRNSRIWIVRTVKSCPCVLSGGEPSIGEPSMHSLMPSVTFVIYSTQTNAGISSKLQDMHQIKRKPL